jgi:hypothetical protein
MQFVVHPTGCRKYFTKFTELKRYDLILYFYHNFMGFKIEVHFIIQKVNGIKIANAKFIDYEI